jgi:alkylation response protein AidB-like acyl-CoA dehydrogenase
MSKAGYARQLTALEAICGDPQDPGHVLGWPAAISRDEAEIFPVDALNWLDKQGFARFHVPDALGGSLLRYEALLAFSRCLARRDPAVALTVAMRTWSELIWMAGSPAQKRFAASLLLERHGTFCLAASERESGADLLSGKVTAKAITDGFSLEGEKWPIGLAARAETILVLARTADGRGPRALSWFLLERRKFSHDHLAASPRLKTLGLRSAELAGLCLKGAVVGRDAMIGDPGSGLELTLKLFQITRALLPGLAIGIADTGLRIALAFACSRTLYGRRAAERPAVRQALAAAYLDLLAAEVLLVSTIRGGFHVCTHELSVTSSIAKIVVPELTGRAMSVAAGVLGARSYLRDGATGIFQKMLRDHGAISIIDGSTAVCLAALATQLSTLASGPASVAGLDVSGRAARLRRRFCLDEDEPRFEPDRLSLTARGCDDVCQELDGPILLDFADAETVPLRNLCDTWRGRRARWRQAVKLSQGLSASGAAAREYAILHAAAACIIFHLHNPHGVIDRLMLAGLLIRALQTDAADVMTLPDDICEHAFRRLEMAQRANQLFSIVPVPLSERPLRIDPNGWY